MNPKEQVDYQGARTSGRRQFLKAWPAGMGTLWLADEGFAVVGAAGSGKPGHSVLAETTGSRPKATRVIFLHMVGGPSQLELFDYKPELHRRDGEPCPIASATRAGAAGGPPVERLLGPQCGFSQHGQSGAWVSEHLPQISRSVDSVAFIKSMQTDDRDHLAAQRSLCTGSSKRGFPSTGSWLIYGLGTENHNLPAHVVLTSGGKPSSIDSSLWGNGFLPSGYQGIVARNHADPVLCLRDPEGWDRPRGSEVIGSVSAIRRRVYEQIGNPELVVPIAQHELAFQMQTAAADAIDVGSESTEVHRLYGAVPGELSFANNCLRARRLIERGVRCVQLFDDGWDTHGYSEAEALNGGFRRKCRQVDRPIAALLQDLKRCGLLEETLVVWSGEFGRGPTRTTGSNPKAQFIGRDHQPAAFTAWLAGGGVRAGITIGATDPLGASVADQPVHVRDLNATVLKLLGLDHRSVLKSAAPVDALIA